MIRFLICWMNQLHTIQRILFLFLLLTHSLFSEESSFINLLYYNSKVSISNVSRFPEPGGGKKTYNTFIGSPFLQDYRFINYEIRGGGVQNSFRSIFLNKGDSVRFTIQKKLSHKLILRTLKTESIPESELQNDFIEVTLNDQKAETDFLSSNKSQNYLSVKANKNLIITEAILIPTTADQKLPDIFFIVVDAMRADVLGCYGAKYNASPNIDSLASESYLFQKNLVNSSWTRPSTLIFFTGVYASRTYINFWDFPVFPNERDAFYKSGINPLPAKLASMGYRAYLLGTNPFFTDHRYLGVDVGFERVKEFSLIEGDDTPVITKHWKDYLENLVQERKTGKVHRPEFLFINYNTPHGPYEPPQEYVGKLSIKEPIHKFKVLYLGEIAYVDVEIGKLVRFLKEKGLYDNSIIVFTADHGEVMNPNHKVSKFTDVMTLFGHGQALYDEDVHTPFLLKLPNQKNGKVIPNLTRSIDIMPTILDVVQGMDGVHKMDGVSMMDIVNGKEKEERVYYGESRAVKGLRKEGFKLQKKTYEFNRTGFSWDGIVKEEPYYLFDLKKDPEENTPINDEDKSRALLEELETYSMPTSVFSLNAFLPKDSKSKTVQYKIGTKAGRVFASDEKGKRIQLPEAIQSEKGLDIKVALVPGESKMIHFIVYPDIANPELSIQVDGREIKKGEYGVGEIDVYPGKCKITMPNCQDLFTLRASPPDPPTSFRIQFWKKATALKSNTSQIILEKDSIDILKKQGYIK